MGGPWSSACEFTLLRLVSPLRRRSRAHDLNFVPRDIDCNLVTAHASIRTRNGRGRSVHVDHAAVDEVRGFIPCSFAAGGLLEQHDLVLRFNPIEFPRCVEKERRLFRGEMTLLVI